jgi:hypothetical protein
MTMEELQELVAPEWRDAYRTFVETGEASDAFLEYLDGDASCQNAVDEAFKAQAAAFQDVVAMLHAADGAAAGAVAAQPAADALSANVALAIDRAGHLEQAELSRAARQLERVVEHQPEAAATLATMLNAVVGAVTGRSAEPPTDAVGARRPR